MRTGIMSGAAFLAVGSLLLTGCVTQIATLPDTRATLPAKALPGVPYSLPMAQYDIVVTRTLSTCPGKDANGEPTELSFSIVPVATPKFVPGEHYVVNYEALNSPLKTSDFSIEYQDKSSLLKSVNASATDQSGEVIKSTVKAGIAIAGLAAGNPALATAAVGANLSQTPSNFNAALAMVSPPSDTPTTSVTFVDCSQKARDALTRIKQLDDSLKIKLSDLAQKTRAVADLTNLANLKIVGSTERGDMITAITNQNAAIDAVADLQDQKTKAIAAISSVDHFTWPTQFAEFYGDARPDAKSVKLAASLLEPHRVEMPTPLYKSTTQANGAKAPPPECQGVDTGLEKCIGVELTLHMQLAAEPTSPHRCLWDGQTNCLGIYDYAARPSPPPGGPRDPIRYQPPQPDLPQTVNASDSFADPGIFVRQPIEGRLVTCPGTLPCSVADGALSTVQLIPQLGQLRFLKLKNGPFEANELSVTLLENGAIQKVEYKRTASSAQVASAALADASTQLKTARDDRDKAKKDAIKSARDEMLAERLADVTLAQDQLAEITAQQAIIKAQTPATPEQDAALKAQVQTLDLQRQLAEAQVAQKKAINEFATLSQTP